MKHFLLSFSLLLIFSGYAQTDSLHIDSVIVEDRIDFTFIALRSDFFIDCAHGHICCESYCSCCQERRREQIYDTLYHAQIDGIQRITIVERYYYAMAHTPSPVRFRFKDSSGNLSPNYYLVKNADRIDYYGDLPFENYPKKIEENFVQEGKILVFDDNQHYFLINLKGEKVPLTFHSKKNLFPDLNLVSILAGNHRVYGLSNGIGELYGDLTYEFIESFQNYDCGIIQNFNNEFGLIGKDGNFILPCQFKSITRLAEHHFSIQKENGWYYLYDACGKQLSDKAYQSIEAFSEGLAIAKRDGNNTVILDLNGRETLFGTVDWASPFQDGKSAVMKNQKWGFIDRNSKLIVEYQFDVALSFYDGVAPVALGSNSNAQCWFLIAETGKRLNSNCYSRIESFKDGIARTFQNGQGYGFIDTKGKEVMSNMYSIDSYGQKDSWFINDATIRGTIHKENTLELVNQKGEQLLDLSAYTDVRFLQFPNPSNLSKSYLNVTKKNNLHNLIDYTGKEILKLDYTFISVYEDGIVIGMRGNTCFLLDLETGTERTKFPGCFIRVENGIIYVQENYTYRHFDLEGNEIVGY